MSKTKKREASRASLIKKTAELTGFSTRHINRILNGEYKRENETSELIMETFMTIAEGENKLLQEVKRIVPLKKVSNEAN